MFGSECSDASKVQVQKVFDVAKVALEERLLGLPTPIGRMNKERFKSTKESLAKKFSSWGERYMCTGGGGSIYSNLCDACFQVTSYVVRGAYTDDTLLLVGGGEIMSMGRCSGWLGQIKVHWGGGGVRVQGRPATV
jgi:hypothetical protein